jgi:formamidopyrimidine-DNA glycosylase
LRILGVEPLTEDFNAISLHALCKGKLSAIKQVLMDAHLIVGIGNIYANESLFRAGIDPRLAAGKLSRPRCARLVDAVREIWRKPSPLAAAHCATSSMVTATPVISSRVMLFMDAGLAMPGL